MMTMPFIPQGGGYAASASEEDEETDRCEYFRISVMTSTCLAEVFFLGDNVDAGRCEYFRMVMTSCISWW